MQQNLWRKVVFIMMSFALLVNQTFSIYAVSESDSSNDVLSKASIVYDEETQSFLGTISFNELNQNLTLEESYQLNEAKINLLQVISKIYDQEGVEIGSYENNVVDSTTDTNHLDFILNLHENVNLDQVSSVSGTIEVIYEEVQAVNHLTTDITDLNLEWQTSEQKFVKVEFNNGTINYLRNSIKESETNASDSEETFIEESSINQTVNLILEENRVESNHQRYSSSDLTVNISTDRTSYANSEFINFSVKYTINNVGSIKKGDVLIVQVPEILKNVDISYSSLHFSACNKKSDTTYELVFNDNANVSLVGYLSITAFGNNTSDKTLSGNVTVGSESIAIQVSPAPNGDTNNGVTQETRAIVKWGVSGDNGYVQDTAVSGVIKTEGTIVQFIIEVNPRRTEMNNVVIKDYLPDELEVVIDDSAYPIEILKAVTSSDGKSYYFNKLSAEETNKIISKVEPHYLEFNFGNLPANVDGNYRIQYYAKVLDTSVKITNKGIIEYNTPTGDQVESSEFTLKSANNAGAAIGYKKVDKAIISNDPSDQIVTYTIEFENDNKFTIGEINLKDKLDPRVKYISSYGSGAFELYYDEPTHTVSIKNIAEIPTSSKQSISIVVDFSNVKPGETVTNTVGANTVKTTKEKQSGMIVLKKVDADNQKSLSGVSFKLFKADGTEVGIYTTNNEGFIEIIGLEIGSYYFEEVASLPGYILTKEKIDFTIEDDQVVAKEIIVQNKKSQGN